MGMSDRIEAFILELLKNDDEWLEIGRNELASVFNCVPSQINYVISTRFGPDRGYIVESRRGGGGCLRIKRSGQREDSLIYEVILRIGSSIDRAGAYALTEYLFKNAQLDELSKNLILSAVSDKSLPHTIGVKRDEIRAGILKNMLAQIQ